MSCKYVGVKGSSWWIDMISIHCINICLSNSIKYLKMKLSTMFSQKNENMLWWLKNVHDNNIMRLLRILSVEPFWKCYLPHQIVSEFDLSNFRWLDLDSSYYTHNPSNSCPASILYYSIAQACAACTDNFRNLGPFWLMCYVEWCFGVGSCPSLYFYFIA